MCVPGEEGPTGIDGSVVGAGPGGVGSAGGGYGGGPVPEIVVTAPRLGIDLDLYQQIDWSEVAPGVIIGGLMGAAGGAWAPVIAGSLGGGALAIEGQDDIDLVDLPEIKWDMIHVPGAPTPYHPLY